MNDLIKRSDAIEAVENVTWYHQNRNKDMVEGANSDEHQAWYKSQDIYEALEALPSADRPQGEWIPCGERLPEEREWIGTKKFGTTISDEVLVTFESRGERFVRPIHFQNGELGGMDKHTMDAVHGEWKAVAWMPLPKPWKGADDE